VAAIKKRLLMARALLAIALIGVAVWALLPGEPRYEGRTLSAWLSEYDIRFDAKYIRPIRPEKKKVDEAVLHIGTNGFPVLLHMLWVRDSAFKEKLAGLSAKTHLYIHFTPAWQSNWRAVMAFDALGTAGKEVVPALVRGLTNSDWTVRMNAARALAAVRTAPELAVPSLVKTLEDTNDWVRVETATALQLYGRAAKPAVPVLLKMLNDPDANIQSGAGRALWAIDPEAARQAGIP